MGTISEILSGIGNISLGSRLLSNSGFPQKSVSGTGVQLVTLRGDFSKYKGGNGEHESLS